MIFYRTAAFLWWSNLRRVFEPIVRRITKNSRTIKTGPLQGYRFQGGPAQMLGIYEYEIQKIFQQNISPGDVFYDIGANNGFFTLLGAYCVSPNGQVYAFEPLPTNTAYIKNAIAQNNLKNCLLEECAITNFTGEAELYYSENTVTPSLLPTENRQVSLRVPTIKLDEYVSTHRRPDLIKLDVEGAELAVLRGAINLISSSYAPTWIIEIHSPNDEEEIYRLLSQGNYVITRIKKSGKKKDQYPIHVVAKKNEK
jgi:FkbM family methyltransferase